MDCEKTETIASSETKPNFNVSSSSVNAAQQALMLQKQSAGKIFLTPLKALVSCYFLSSQAATSHDTFVLFTEGLMALLREIGTAYQHLSQYNCRKAIECLEALPSQHFNTGWVLSLMGKAYFELSDFQTSVR